MRNTVLTEKEGNGLQMLANGIMERYAGSAVPPPEAVYADRGCCSGSGGSQVISYFAQPSPTNQSCFFLVCSQCTCHFSPSLLIVINGKLQMDHMCDKYARDTFSAQVEEKLTELGRVARFVVLNENGCFDIPQLETNHEEADTRIMLHSSYR